MRRARTGGWRRARPGAGCASERPRRRSTPSASSPGERLFAALSRGWRGGRKRRRGEEAKREREREVYGRRKKGSGGGDGVGGGRWKWTEIAKWAGRAFFMDFKAGPALRVG